MHSEDDFMDSDDVVTDGAPCLRKAQFPQGPFTSTKEAFGKDGGSKCDIDSGFLSGLSISEELSSAFNSSLSLAEDPDNMKIKSAVLYSDSGVDLDYPSKFRNNLGSSTANIKSEQINKPSYTNNLEAPNKPTTPKYKFTLQDLVRQDEDGDTILHHAV